MLFYKTCYNVMFTCRSFRSYHFSKHGYMIFIEYVISHFQNPHEDKYKIDK